MTVKADGLAQSLRSHAADTDIDAAARLLGELRDQREFVRLCELAELVLRLRPDDFKARRLYGQGLIETGRLAAAASLLESARQEAGPEHPQAPELSGVLGRAYKQLFMDSPASTDGARANYLARSFAAYRVPFELDPGTHFWHGVNLAALSHLAMSRGSALVGARTPKDYADDVLSRLTNLPEVKRDGWWHATRAECCIALRQWPEAELELQAFLADSKIPTFHLGSSLRQLRDIWRIQESGPTGARLLQALEAAVSKRPDGGVAMAASDIAASRAVQGSDPGQLQRVIGDQGVNTLTWYRTGLERAAAVASVRERLGLRFGSGFVVLAGNFGVEPAQEKLLLTNWHVLNRAGLGARRDFANVEVAFEAAEGAPVCRIGELIDESPADQGLDFALFRLRAPPAARLPEPLPVSASVDGLQRKKARIYVIGYPLGNELQFSLQDNQLLDHECDEVSTPPNKDRRRLHYLAATQKGSSGSPVFDEYWDCIALHHAGSADMPEGIAPLNGRQAYVKANEGIWIGSIQALCRARAAERGGAAEPGAGSPGLG